MKKKFYCTIMSIDPDENPEDQHQKYGTSVEAHDAKEAEQLAREWFDSEYGYPIDWVQVGQGMPLNHMSM